MTTSNLAILFIALACSQPATRSAAAGEKLVPAQYSSINDKQGYPWDVRQNGMIEDGRNDCFDGGLMLTLHGQQFQAANAQMTPDRREYVLHNTIRATEVTRRILIDVDNSHARYLDTFHNTSKSKQTFPVEIRTMLGGSCQQVVTSQGKAFTGTFAKGDIGLAALNPSGSRPSVVFLLTDAKGKVRPNVTVQGNRDFRFTFPLELRPKQKVSIYYVVAQRSNFAAKGLAAFYKPLYRNRLIKPSIPRELVSTVANFRMLPPEDAPGPWLQTVITLAEDLGIERAGHDTLIFSEESQLKGTVRCEQLGVSTSHGDADLDIRDLALLVGGAGIDRPMRAYLRNGEVLSGEVHGQSMVLTTGDGLDIRLEPSLLDKLFLQADKQRDGKPPSDAAAVIQTRQGNRIAVSQTGATKIHAATAWGRVEFTLDQVDYLWSRRVPAPSKRAILADETRLSMFITDPPLQVNSLRWGKISLPGHDIDRVRRVLKEPAPPELAPPEDVDDDLEAWNVRGPYCLLIGNNLLAGKLDQPTLRIVTATGVRDLKVERIRQLQRDEDDEGSGTQPLFRFDVRGGGQIVGRLEQATVPIRTQQRVWQVPVEQWISARFEPKPAAPEPSEVVPDDEADDETKEDTKQPPLPMPPAAPADPFSGAAPPASPLPADPFGGAAPATDPNNPFK